MADITITITKANVYQELARRSTIAAQTDPVYVQDGTEKKQLHELHGESDRLTGDLVSEAGSHILKLFISRQGDAAGTPFEDTAASIVYRFSEGSPSIGQADAVTQRLTQNVEQAIIYYALLSLYKLDGNRTKAEQFEYKFNQLAELITSDLYRLHD